MAEGKILTYLDQLKEFHTVQRAIEGKVGDQMIYGMTDVQNVFFMAGLIDGHKGPSLVITYSSHQGRKVTENLINLLPNKEVLLFPNFETLPYETIARSNEISIKRMKVIESLLLNRDITIVVAVDALTQPMSNPKGIKERIFPIKVGESLQLEDLPRTLIDLGYERVARIEGKGQFSLRGGIVDIYPLINEFPVRIELFDDEVDSLRSFEVNTQRSLDKLQEALIMPAREMVLSDEDWQRGLEELKSQIAQQEKRLLKKGFTEPLHRFKEKFNYIMEKVEDRLYFDGLETYIKHFYGKSFSLFDYFQQQPLVLLEEPARIKEKEDLTLEEWRQSVSGLLEKGELLPLNDSFSLEGLLAKQGESKVGFSLLPKKVPFLLPRNIVSIAAKSVPTFMGNLNLFIDEIKAWKKANYQVVILTENEIRSKKIKNILEDYNAFNSKISIIEATLSQGFEFSQQKLAFVTEKDIFGQSKKKRTKLTNAKNKRESFTSIQDLKVGDYVVHVNHGIGKYVGIEKLEVGGIQKEYLSIKYFGEDRLYVPTEQIELIQRYLGAEGQKPKVNKLGGSDWIKIKNKAKQSVEDLAEDLLKLYAARESLPGFAFSKDTVWQKDFEDAFPFEETPDQLRAIEEIKTDMESPRPMERLLCGDVGYGKTEVALRAAFKSVMDGRQVAVLVPTTILAQQHYNTFLQRFEGFPVNIEMLSRFRTPKEQRETIKKLSQGLVDIVIGTHRLVQEDIKFKELGLLVIDEEQRFGVSHKEKLKRLKENVDVIILTATPIPRTLYLSLSGARDMSVLESPPEERFPVQTYVAEFNPNMIRDAIEREIGRGGQIYYVHNRVQDIDKEASFLQKLVPEARIIVAHGQMKEEELEQVMIEFMKGEHDLLICTTIIETGLDIPNVNTLIVNNADKLGLSQLYQLRGRVGRSNRVAYAYFTYRKDKVLTEIAEKRLQAIKEFTAFGSGFKIAMRDLEIRGAGNILGAEQHGNIVSVGYELYCQLLEEAVANVKGKTFVKEQPVAIELNVDAYIAEEYIKEQVIKIEIYKKIVAINTMVDLQELEEELEDRFGDPPLELRQLLYIAKLKVFAKEIGLRAITQKGDQIVLSFWNPNKLSGEQLFSLSRSFPRRLSFDVAEGLDIKLVVKGYNQGKILSQIEEVIVEIKRLRTS